MISSTRSGSSAPCGCGGAHASTSVSVSSSSGCGCGCGSGGHCGCGTADCRDGAIVRPLFFAGQLLTEEDLQALSGYVAAKSRLHNRDFFGEGVACGFEVVCHPCGGGKVIVRPGHALDCCGNDIVLSAAQTLDVNALVRELRKKLRDGIDCGDPCAEPGHGEPRQRYCLYARYCEALTDPVSAFATDEPCGTAACEPTRLREGLRFELRCGDKAKPSGGLLCQVASCLGDPVQLGKVIDDLTVLDHLIQESEAGFEVESRSFDIDELRKSKDALVIPTSPAPTDRDIRSLVARMDVVRAHLDLYNKLDRKPPLPVDLLPAVHAKLEEAGEKIVAYVRNLLTTDPQALRVKRLERSFIRRVVTLAELAISTAEGTHVVLWTFSPQQVPELGSQLDELLRSLFERLRGRLEIKPEITGCQLGREVRDLDGLSRVPNPPRPDRDAISLALRLRNAWWHFLQECICPALLPPCPSCDDPGVLLACLEVESCEVVRICNLERSIVPTAVALRHWLPLHLLGDLAEALCCRDLGQLELSKLLEKLCPFEVKVPEFTKAFGSLRQLILEREPPSTPTAWTAFQALPPAPIEIEPVPIAVPEPAPALDREELIRAVEERLDLGAVRRLETTQKKSIEGLKQAQSDLASLRRELGEQVAKNAALEKRLKALEGRRKP